MYFLYACRDLYKEHNELCSKCIKDDTKHLCSKCGTKPRNSVICAECDKVQMLHDVYTNTYSMK